jgi:hypothetical protein
MICTRDSLSSQSSPRPLVPLFDEHHRPIEQIKWMLTVLATIDLMLSYDTVDVGWLFHATTASSELSSSKALWLPEEIVCTWDDKNEV